MKGKIQVLLIFLITSISLTSYGQPIQVKSSVKKAVLYLNGAFLTRIGQVQLTAGKNKLLFTDLPGNIRLESLQLTPDEQTRIISVQPYYSFEKKSSELSSLNKMKDTIFQIQSELQTMDIDLKILSEEESILKKNQPSFTGDFVAKPAELNEIIDFNSLKLSEIFSKKVKTEHEYNVKKRNLETIKKRYVSYLQKLEQRTTVIEAEVEASGDEISEFTITYFSLFASWQPMYDARVNSVLDPIELTLKASIIQNTGEDWKDVELSVSNGQPSGKEIHPVIEAWHLDYFTHPHQQPIVQGKYNPDVRQVSGKIKDQNGDPLIGATVFITELNTVGTVTDVDGNYFLPVPVEGKSITVQYIGYNPATRYVESESMGFVLSENSGLLDEMVVLGGRSSGVKKSNQKDKIISDYMVEPSKITYQPTTFSYDINEKVTISSNFTSVLIDINTQKIPAIYEYSSVPKYDPSVFLNAGLTVWRDNNLVSGKANLYLEGRFSGQTFIDTKTATDTLWLSLGRDRNIIIERTKIKDFVKKSFFSGNITENQAFVINLRNNKKQPVKIRVLDQFPISSNKDITVFDEDAKSAHIDPATKIIRWYIDMEPFSETKKEIKYSVKYPSDKRVVLE